MCGIFAVFGHGGDVNAFRDRALHLSKKIRHRGPDWSGIKVSGRNVLCHERLAIVGLASGAQPLTNHDDSVILCVNGEIYNHRALRKLLKKDHTFKTESDCEVILHLYEEMGPKFVDLLDGIFSFVLYDARADMYMIARDPIGVTTLFQGWSGKDNSVWVCSEMKALNEDCDRIIAFPPGHMYLSSTGKTERYFNPSWWDPARTPRDAAADAGSQFPLATLRHSLERAVKKRLMTEVPFGVLLSGGLDSSIIAAIAVRYTRRAAREAANAHLIEAQDAAAIAAAAAASAVAKDTEISPTSGRPRRDSYVESAVAAASLWPRLHSFSIGIKGSPDLAAAQRAADFLGTAHRSFEFTVQEGLDALSDVIYHLETYDVTTIRASTPMYLLTRMIKAMGVKMVLSGEGSDEVFGGYLYFHKAPSDEEFHAECVKRVHNLHTADCLRANKSTMAWGVEARVPFLDREFLDVAMNMDPRHKRCSPDRMEKWVLRAAFDTPEDPYLPDDILWRQKEQFSDGVGYSWIDTLKETCEKAVSDEKWAARHVRFPQDTPDTREAYYYREIFDRHFPQRACTESVVRWVPRLDWGCDADPSGRAQTAHSSSYATSNGVAPAAPVANGNSTLKKDRARSPSPARNGTVPSPKKVKV